MPPAKRENKASIEELYTKQKFKRPKPCPLETIYEEPKVCRFTGVISNSSRLKFKRQLDFNPIPSGTKVKARHRRATLLSKSEDIGDRTLKKCVIGSNSQQIRSPIVNRKSSLMNKDICDGKNVEMAQTELNTLTTGRVLRSSKLLVSNTGSDPNLKTTSETLTKSTRKERCASKCLENENSNQLNNVRSSKRKRKIP